MKKWVLIKKTAGLLAAGLLASSSAWANFGGTIYCDANCDGSFGGGDVPLSGVTVNAYSCGTSTLVGSPVSGLHGSYEFEPSPTMSVWSFYCCCVVVPSGYRAGGSPGNP